jgi:hypothetical protein
MIRGVLLLLKIVLTPALITAATLLGRRLGPAFAGWLVGFPFTSAPVSLFLALEQGIPFAGAAAVGSVASVIAQAAFALAYARTARRGWPTALLAGSLAFAAAGVALGILPVSLVSLALLATGALLLGLRLLPSRRERSQQLAPTTRWDLPARAVIATVLVVALTTVAPLLGPFASGLLSGFPLYATVLAVFAHRTAGADPAADVMRGLTAGLFGFAAFFLAIGTALDPLGITGAFLVASLSVAVVQAVSFAVLRRSRQASPG